MACMAARLGLVHRRQGITTAAAWGSRRFLGQRACEAIGARCGPELFYEGTLTAGGHGLYNVALHAVANIETLGWEIAAVPQPGPIVVATNARASNITG